MVVKILFAVTLVATAFLVANAADAQSKLGTCPTSPGTSCSNTSTTCKDDSGCNGDLKCCDNGCGKSCTKPVPPPRPGDCPNLLLRLSQEECQRSSCTTDKDCRQGNAHLKCCSNRCGGRMCLQPIGTDPQLG